MDSGDVFAESGPKHMMAKAGVGSSPATMIETDWYSSEHRRCVAACIVKGTYVLESDRAKGRLGEALAPAWWTSFHFRLLQMLECDCSSCILSVVGANRSFIYGAIYEYAPPGRRHSEAPHYIVAFRGTMLRDPTTMLNDIYLDASIALNMQHRCHRFREAREQVEQLLEKISTNNGGASGGGVWLAGHSLGASIALDVGRDIAARKEPRRRHLLPTFLFNPPHVSLAPLAYLLRLPDAAKRNLCAAKCKVKTAILFGSTLVRSHVRRMEALFEQLESWVPELFVHRSDIICNGFIDYLEQRQEILDRAPSELRWLTEEATKLSLRDTLTSFRGSSTMDDEEEMEELMQRVQPHLLPCARLWKNSTKVQPHLLPCAVDSHSLQQWWEPNYHLNLSSRRYGLS